MKTSSGAHGGNQEVSNYYLSESGESYFAWQKGGGGNTGKLEAAMFQEFVTENDDVVDFGCGGGYVLKALSCKSRFGIEVNPAALEECRKNNIQATNDITSVPSESFDVALSIHSLEHVLNPLRSLQEILRVLRVGGRLLLCTPVDDWRVYRRYSTLDIHHHLYTWSPQNLGNLLQESGFSVQNVSLYSYAWPPKVLHLYRYLPFPIFNLVCTVWGVATRYRQVVAIATKRKVSGALKK